jgi:hypothetical protein
MNKCHILYVYSYVYDLTVSTVLISPAQYAAENKKFIDIMITVIIILRILTHCSHHFIYL